MAAFRVALALSLGCMATAFASNDPVRDSVLDRMELICRWMAVTPLPSVDQPPGCFGAQQFETEEVQRQMFRFWDDVEHMVPKNPRASLPAFEQWASDPQRRRAVIEFRVQREVAQSNAKEQQAQIEELERQARDQREREERVARNLEEQHQWELDAKRKELAARARMIASASKTDIVTLCKQYRSNRLAPLMNEIRARGVFTARESDAIEGRKVFIGMTEGALRCSWGDADHINRTITAGGTHLQIIFGDSYVYTDNGIVTALQDRQ